MQHLNTTSYPNLLRPMTWGSQLIQFFDPLTKLKTICQRFVQCKEHHNCWVQSSLLQFFCLRVLRVRDLKKKPSMKTETWWTEHTSRAFLYTGSKELDCSHSLAYKLLNRLHSKPRTTWNSMHLKLRTRLLSLPLQMQLSSRNPYNLVIFFPDLAFNPTHM
jgi:hypothetical protein